MIPENVKIENTNDSVFITESVYQEIMDTIGSASPESGGILGIKDGVISDFCLDENPSGTGNTYIPDLARLNSVLQMWHQTGVEFAGVIHSHPSDMRQLSYADIRYAMQIMNANDLCGVYFPLVFPDTKEIFFYNVSSSGRVVLNRHVIKKYV